MIQRFERINYAKRADRVVIRHGRGRVVAIIEIMSPGNKESRHAFRSFVEKAADILSQGIHRAVGKHVTRRILGNVAFLDEDHSSITKAGPQTACRRSVQAVDRLETERPSRLAMKLHETDAVELKQSELESLAAQNVADPNRIAQAVRRTVGKWVGETYRRQPMIVPTVIEI